MALSPETGGPVCNPYEIASKIFNDIWHYIISALITIVILGKGYICSSKFIKDPWY